MPDSRGKIDMTLLLVVCAVAISHALFWAFVLIGMNHRLSNRLLAILLILISIRVGKSVVGMLVSKDYMYFFATAGVVSMAGIGPTLLLFTRSLFDSQYHPKRVDGLHFVPMAALLLVAFFPSWANLNLTYFVITWGQAGYLAAAMVYLYSNRETLRSDDMKWKWIHFIIGGVAILWVTFVCQINFYQPLVYLSIVVTAALVFYSLSWYAIPRSRLFIAEPQRKVSETQVYTELGDRIATLFQKEEIFTQPDLNVSNLAARLKVPPYMVSRAVNQCFNKSFSEYVVEFRIRKSETLLRSDAQKNLTVEAIAFESGFNTLSAFYKAFRKINGMTPSQFRNQVS